MAERAVNLGVDFLFPKLHGRWSTALVGHRLEELIRGGSLQILGRTLSTLGISIQDRAAVQKNLSLFLIKEIGWLANLLDETGAAVYRCLLERFYLENLKTLIRYRCQDRDPRELAYLLVESEYLPSLDFERMIQAHTLHEFYGLIPQNAYRQDLLPILVEADGTKDIFVADAKIDRLYYARLLEIVGGLSGTRGRLASDLIGTEIDVTNIITALRNVSVYRLKPKDLAPLFLPGGCLVSPDAALALGNAQEPKGLWPALPREYRREVKPFENDEHYRCENALAGIVYRKAQKAFKDYSRPELSTIAYPFLKRFEILNIGRLFEGLYLKLDIDIIRSMMIGL